MNDSVICFSVDKSDVLNYYSIDSSKGGYTAIDSKDNLHLSYPDTCIKLKLENGYKYNIHYGLNGKKYSDYFFIDKEGKL
nr:hypothetical protein [Citrobacter amalonaticus]